MKKILKNTRAHKDITRSRWNINKTPEIFIPWSYKAAHIDNQPVTDNRYISGKNKISQSDSFIQEGRPTNNG